MGVEKKKQGYFIKFGEGGLLYIEYPQQEDIILGEKHNVGNTRGAYQR